MPIAPILVGLLGVRGGLPIAGLRRFARKCPSRPSPPPLPSPRLWGRVRVGGSFAGCSPVHGTLGVYTIGMLMDPALGRVIERCRDGDRNAFEEVVDRYGLQLLRTARLILRDQALAADAVQETFLRAWQRIGSLRDEDPGPWLNRIAMNESISAYRRRHRFQALTERFCRPGGGKHQVSSESRLDLAHALDPLSAELRAVVAHHYLLDLSVEDTAKAPRIPVDTMKSRLKTALRRLRDLTVSEEISA